MQLKLANAIQKSLLKRQGSILIDCKGIVPVKVVHLSIQARYTFLPAWQNPDDQYPFRLRRFLLFSESDVARFSYCSVAFLYSASLMAGYETCWSDTIE
jgi:hypothetical protein